MKKFKLLNAYSRWCNRCFKIKHQKIFNKRVESKNYVEYVSDEELEEIVDNIIKKHKKAFEQLADM